MFENILKIPKYGSFLMILVSVKNAYKVFVFLKVFQKSVCEKDVLFFVSKRLTIFYPYSRSFMLFSAFR